jgi:hypothetical protein
MKKQIQNKINAGKTLSIDDKMEIVHRQLKFKERCLKMAFSKNKSDAVIARLEMQIDELNEKFMTYVNK